MDNVYNENERFIPIISDYGFKVTFENEGNFIYQIVFIKSP